MRVFVKQLREDEIKSTAMLVGLNKGGLGRVFRLVLCYDNYIATSPHPQDFSLPCGSLSHTNNFSLVHMEEHMLYQHQSPSFSFNFMLF